MSFCQIQCNHINNNNKKKYNQKNYAKLKYNKILPKSFNDFFTTRSEVHNYHTRNRNNYNHTRNKKFLATKQ